MGASLGAQVTASMLAGSAAAGSSVPTDSGFTEAFAIGAVVAALAASATLLIPRQDKTGGRRARVPARPIYAEA